MWVGLRFVHALLGSFAGTAIRMHLFFVSIVSGLVVSCDVQFAQPTPLDAAWRY
jgi:hypothetical protein